LLEYFLGSVSTELIEKSKLPVFIIPESISFMPIKQIAFATEIKLGIRPILSQLHQFAEELGAKVQQVFVQQLPSDISDAKEEVFYTGWQEEAGNEYSEVTVIRDKSVTEGIDYFIEKHQIDVLAMEFHQRTPIQQFFHRSQTKRMIFHSRVPILVFYA
jgi:nucleotide-binding universal stress UspA family protein